jgi:hypothetical protein
MTCLATLLGLGVHSETPFAVERAAWRPIGRKVAAGESFNSEPIACFSWDKLDYDIVSDYVHGKPVDLRNGSAERFCGRDAGTCSKSRHHGGDETDAAGAKRTCGWQE